MVKRGLAVREDTRSVVRPVGGIDSDGNGLLLEGSSESSGGLGDISEGSDTI